ncbi:DUF1761 domain-containing protein [Hyphococcus sp.]|uniref:DUF1761 domain-containing protein n=1 Tax=Hyphococcus sp. TaxID=2038636 RepID=UPI003CCC2C82
MPKVLGLNLVGVIVASVAFYFVGFLWYGLLFSEAWMNAEGLTAADAEGQSPIWMIGGFLITVLQVIGIGLVLKWKGAASLGEAATTALILWFFLALPFVHYAYLYLPAHSVTLLLIDASHLLVGWVVSAIVLSLIK